MRPDALVSFGELGPVFAVAAALGKRACLVFTVDSADVGGVRVDSGYRLEATGRYSRRRAYPAERRAAPGFMPVSIAAVPLGTESGIPVTGYVATAMKRSSTGAGPQDRVPAIMRP